VAVLATHQRAANGTLPAAAGTQTAPALKVTTSMTSKVSQGARILLRGRDEDLGIDAIGNMARFGPHAEILFTLPTSPAVLQLHTMGTSSGSTLQHSGCMHKLPWIHVCNHSFGRTSTCTGTRL